DVPQQHLVLDPELGEDAVDDRRARLGRPLPRELALGGEGEAADTRAAIARSLADQDDGRVAPGLEVGGEPFLAQTRAVVLVERLADPGRGESVYQRSQRTTSSSGSHGNFRRDEPRPSSGAACPIVTTPTT